MLLFPLLAAQRFSYLGGVQLGSIFLSLRRRRRFGDPFALRRIDLSQPYVAVCLLAAGTAIDDLDPWFFPVSLLIAALALYATRSIAYPKWLWVATLAVVAGAGFVTQQGVRQAQNGLEEWVIYWLEGLIGDNHDPSQLTTAIGRIGELKLSDRIIWQLDHQSAVGGIPELLPRAVYRRYSHGRWSASEFPVEPVAQLLGREGWRLRQGEAGEGALTISGELPEHKGILPLPEGAVTLEGLLAESVKINQLGTLVADGTPEFVRYRVDQGGQGGDLPPAPEDLELPANLQETLAAMVTRLGLRELPPGQAIARVNRLFQEEFRYTLFRREMRYDIPPLRDFLLHSKAGHCEYFASAGALLLRAAGIPARYVSGFAVLEYSELSDSWLLRKRHAHAWVLAHTGEGWQSADFTPPVWVEEEQQTAPWWSGISDLWTLIDYAMQRSAMDREESDSNLLYYIALIALVAFLAKRLYSRPKRLLAADEADAWAGPGGQGLDSPFLGLLEGLSRVGLGPRRGETGWLWLARLEAMESISPHAQPLREALQLHYRLRFDPLGLDDEGRARLAQIVTTLRQALGG
jgi:transglutaminase-like putative cysteine protease